MPNCKERDWNKPLRWRTRQMAFELPQREREIQRSAFNTGKWSLLLFTWLPPRFMMLMGLEMNTLASYYYPVLKESHHLYYKGKIWYCYQSYVNLFGVKEALFGHESIRMLCVELVPDLLNLLLRHLVLPHHYPHLQKIQYHNLLHYHLHHLPGFFALGLSISFTLSSLNISSPSSSSCSESHRLLGALVSLVLPILPHFFILILIHLIIILIIMIRISPPPPWPWRPLSSPLSSPPPSPACSEPSISIS